jgi:NADH-quinone oxidoreductase subunit N
VRTLYALGPEAVITGFATISLFAARLRPRYARWLPTAAVAAVLVALGLELWFGARVGTLFGSGFSQDRFALFAKAAVLLAVAAVLAVADWEEEVASLGVSMALLAGLGGMVAASATGLLGLWAGLELAGLAAVLAVAAGTAARREVALRLLLFNGVAAALVAFSFAYLYSVAGVSQLADLRTALRGLPGVTLPLAIAVLVGIGGLAARLGLAPFHFGLLDVARRAPPLGAGLVSGVAAGTAGIVLLKLISVLGPVAAGWSWGLAGVACIAMVVGGLGALGAASGRELAAFAAVCQAGWVVAPLAVNSPSGVAAGLFLLGVFMVAAATAPAALGGRGAPAGAGAQAGWSSLVGLASLSPARGAAFSLAVLSLAGVPPLGGFLAEFSIAAELVKGRMPWLLVAGLTGSALVVAGSLRALRLLYLEAPGESERAGMQQARARVAARLGGPVAALTIGGGAGSALVVTAYGAFANPIYSLALQGVAALGLR